MLALNPSIPAMSIFSNCLHQLNSEAVTLPIRLLFTPICVSSSLSATFKNRCGSSGEATLIYLLVKTANFIYFSVELRQHFIKFVWRSQSHRLTHNPFSLSVLSSIHLHSRVAFSRFRFVFFFTTTHPHYRGFSMDSLALGCS